MRRAVDIVMILALLGAAGYVVYTHPGAVKGVVRVVEQKFAPCSSPLTYSIGAVDSRFGIPRSVLIQDLKEAEAIWEKPAGKDLFSYEETGGDVTVSLVYDSRQASTDKLKALGIQVDTSKATYDALKARYDALSAKVDAEQSHYEQLVAAYKQDEAAYNAEVQRANSRGGAQPAEYARIQSDKAALEAEFSALKSYEAAMNEDIGTQNALATTINQLIVQLNLNVDQYNGAGAAAGEFEEGLYKSEGGVQSIDIYEYSDHVQLVRVLAHEMGHALGLDHVGDSGAIMYKLNQGTSLTAGAADIAELDAVCHLK